VKLPAVGDSENLRREFKSREVLAKPATVGRAVVAMLNAKGGVIWIGIPEQSGVAAPADPVERPEMERATLYNHLLDTIEPRLDGDELTIVSNVENPGVLEVQVNPKPARRPYAQIKQGGRHFHLRVDGRVREMSWEEVKGAFLGEALDDDAARVKKALLDARSKTRSKTGLWCWVQPMPARSLTWGGSRAELERLLKDPERSGSRGSGAYVSNRYYNLQFKRSVVATTDWMELTLRADGQIELWSELPYLMRRDEPNVIDPYALLQVPLSLFRLARSIFESQTDSESRPIESIAVDLVMSGVLGVGLRGGSPRSPFFQIREPPRFGEGNFELLEPVIFDWKQFKEQPGRSVLRLVRELYSELGHPDSALPSQFDPATGNLIFPE
jgi:hypothetical protein